MDSCLWQSKQNRHCFLLADLLNSPPTEQVFLVPLDAAVINNNFQEAFNSKGKDHLRSESDAVIGAKAQASPDLSMPTLFTATDPLQAPNPNPLSRLTGIDPFLSMAGRWDQATVHTLLMDSSQNLSESTNKNPEQLLAPMRSLDEIFSRQFIQGPDSISQNLQPISPKMDSLSIDANSLFIMNESRGTQDNQSEFSGQGQDQSNNQDPSQSQFYAALPNSGINSKFNVQATSNAAETSKVPPHISQSVFDKSSMLIKDGGGSLRIDLGSRDNGPLDLAVNINGNNVDIRIITHSQQARDALMQDLPRLRDSLLNHHLNLDKVEIGISNNATWSQSSGDGRQSRQQQFENIKESELRGLTGIRATRSSYRSSAQSISNDTNPLHNGLIQVRV
ncbi:MAG: flagellar hook-length control protein FliK [Proteobacteria bacterium]|nr:flagellar hook-length control protein FliK [Pseudomonadota bacterium]